MTIRCDKDCYLCPTNTRATGDTNPDYADTFVFTNDYSAVLPTNDEFVEDCDSKLFQQVNYSNRKKPKAKVELFATQKTIHKLWHL